MILLHLVFQCAVQVNDQQQNTAKGQVLSHRQTGRLTWYIGRTLTNDCRESVRQPSYRLACWKCPPVTGSSSDSSAANPFPRGTLITYCLACGWKHRLHMLCVIICTHCRPNGIYLNIAVIIRSDSDILDGINIHGKHFIANVWGSRIIYRPSGNANHQAKQCC